ncbi:MAG: NarK/NasA family nitrate transporter [Cyanobacteria bacterium SZAS LIN-3]|nr:NarK/NasA family nitrate transporter [Cyanobacteria bacterium SZAS LIN-3]MBS2006829.1 NarK/NasA family nitrate transporter [Cyanobacteria bacterium SZAS TMP-1]
MTASPDSNQRNALIMGTLAFMVSFAIWGLLAGLMPSLKKELHLTASQASLLVAIPVILGSLGRLPAGLLADRYGGKIVMTVLLFLSAISAFILGFVHDYNSYIITAIFLGFGGATFSVGVTFVSRWFPPAKQGTALGIFGAGNLGQSLAVFGIPLLAAVAGRSGAVWSFATCALLYAIVFAVVSRDAEWTQAPKDLGSMLKVFFTRGMCWVLSLLYFQTFGGFVALAIYMPMLLKDLFDLTPADAGFRTAMFVVLATAARPLGGYLSDKIGSQLVLLASFAGLLPCALIMTNHDFGYFTVGALGAAFLVGLGNGGVFKLVPQYFPKDVGTVTGLVGAAGGMGGFFPPLVLGYCKDHYGTYNPGFYFLAGFAALCLVVLYLAIIRPSGTPKGKLLAAAE